VPSISLFQTVVVPILGPKVWQTIRTPAFAAIVDLIG
jgi:hypothetical protein